MEKIREVLQLKAAGFNIRQIAASTGAARTTVHEYLARAKGAGLSWPLPEWREAHRELRSPKHVTLVPAEVMIWPSST